MNSIPYFGSSKDKQFVEIINFYNTHDSASLDKSITLAKNKIGVLLRDYCVEDFLGFLNKENNLFYCPKLDELPEDLREVMTFYGVANSTKDGQDLIFELFFHIENDGEVQAHISFFPAPNVDQNIAVCLNRMASMYANFDPNLEVSDRQTRFLSYTNTFKYPVNDKFKGIFELLEFDTSLNLELNA